MKIRAVLALSLALCLGSHAFAQAEAPEVTEARRVVIAYCQAFLDGDSDTALEHLDLSAQGSNGYARLVPLLCNMTHAEAQLYASVEQHFGEESNKTLRSSNSISTMPVSIIENMEYLSVDLDTNGEMAVLRAPAGNPDEEPIDIFLLIRDGDSWKIDPESSLGVGLPQTDEDWQMWEHDTQMFVSLMNELREQVPQMNSTDEYNEQFQASIAELQEQAENNAE